MVTHSTWKKLHWTLGLLAPSQSSVHSIKWLLASRCSFQVWKDPEDILWDDLGLLMSPSHLQDQWAKFKARLNSLLDHCDHHAHLHAVSMGAVMVSDCLPLQIHSPPSTSPRCPGRLTFKHWVSQAPLASNSVQLVAGNSRRSDDKRRFWIWS